MSLEVLGSERLTKIPIPSSEKAQHVRQGDDGFEAAVEEAKET